MTIITEILDIMFKIIDGVPMKELIVKNLQLYGITLILIAIIIQLTQI